MKNTLDSIISISWNKKYIQIKKPPPSKSWEAAFNRLNTSHNRISGEKFFD